MREQTHQAFRPGSGVGKSKSMSFAGGSASRTAYCGRQWLTLRRNSPGKQEEAIISLLSSRNTEEAAWACHIPPGTHHWLEEKAFTVAYREARRQAYQQSIARLQEALGRRRDNVAESNGGPSDAVLNAGQSR